MASLMEDQASGLRRIFALASNQPGPQIISFVGGSAGLGQTSRNKIVAEIARGLATQGKEVLVIDENHGPDSVAATFGLTTRFDLMQAVNGDVPPHQVILQAETAIRIVPAARAARESRRQDSMQRRAVAEWLKRLQKNVDVVLVDSALRSNGFSLLHPAPSRVVVVTAANSVGIKEAYGYVKHLAKQDTGRSFEVVVACASRQQEGEIVFENIRQVAQTHLNLVLRFLGCVSIKQNEHNFSTDCQALAEALLHSRGAMDDKDEDQSNLSARNRKQSEQNEVEYVLGKFGYFDLNETAAHSEKRQSDKVRTGLQAAVLAGPVL